MTLGQLSVASLAAAVLCAAVPDATASRRHGRCTPPRSGDLACLSLRYRADAGALVRVRTTATLLRRVGTCPDRRHRRRVVLRRAGERLAAERRRPRCRHGVLRWRTVFSPGESEGWELAAGDRVQVRWSGSTATTAVVVDPED